MGTDAVVGNAQRHPYGTFASGPFADNLHYPRLVGVADGDALASAVVSVFSNQFGHTFYCLSSRCRPLQRQPHQAEIVEQTVAVLHIQPPVKGGFNYSDLMLIHQAYDIVGVFHLFDELSFVRRSPSANGYQFVRCVATCRAIEK